MTLKCRYYFITQDNETISVEIDPHESIWDAKRILLTQPQFADADDLHVVLRGSILQDHIRFNSLKLTPESHFFVTPKLKGQPKEPIKVREETLLSKLMAKGASEGLAMQIIEMVGENEADAVTVLAAMR